MNGVVELLNYGTQESLAGIKEICIEAEYCFLNSENSMVRENGIELLEEIYARFWKYILENQEKILYQEPFNLFNEMGSYVVDAIKEMPPEKVQKYVRWDSFIESVQRITFWVYWKRILESCFWTYTANIPEKRVEDFLNARCITKFNYIYGFIANGLDALVIDSFFGGAMANIFRFEEKHEILLGLLVHCVSVNNSG